MRGLSAVAALLLLASCGEEISPEEQALQDERDVAMVQAANDVAPPLRQVTPEPITAPDIERYDLFGETCNYAPGTSLGTRVIARESDAFFKLEGEIVRLAADPGSRELPARTRTLYSGKEYSLRLTIDGEGEPAPSGAAVNYEGSVTVRDAHGREVYEGTGLAQCSD
jgi:hypothetical protein